MCNFEFTYNEMASQYKIYKKKIYLNKADKLNGNIRMACFGCLWCGHHPRLLSVYTHSFKYHYTDDGYYSDRLN